MEAYKGNMGESLAHEVLKRHAANLLKNLGCKVEFEKPVRVANKSYRVDVVGEKDGKKIAVECGKTKRSKLKDLSKIFDEVKHIRYRCGLTPKDLEESEMALRNVLNDCPPKDEKRDWQTIKVKKPVYEDLKRMGKGIGKAVEMCVAAQKQEIQKKIEDVQELGSDIAAIMLEQGIFDIKFRGAGIQDVTEDGDMLTIRGFVNVVISNEDARAKIVEVLRGKEEEDVEIGVD